MNVDIVLFKLRQAINKLDSQDYDNVENYVLLDYFNKCQLLYLREQLRGYNLSKDGDEGSKINLNSFQTLIKTQDITYTSVNKKDIYYWSSLPADYYLIKRVDITAEQTDCKCLSNNFRLYMAENYMCTTYYHDAMKSPSFGWRESFYTIADGELRIYYKDFIIRSASITYYRKPRIVEKNGVFSTFLNVVSTADVDPELPDDVVENIIMMAASYIGGDIQDQASYQIHANNRQTTS